MMCIIRIVDGKPFEHPIMVDNFKQAFPDVDLSAPLPEGFAWFERKERPSIDPLTEVFISGASEYEFDGNVWTDVWKVRDTTYEEKQAVIAQAYTNFKNFLTNEKPKFALTPDGVEAWDAVYNLVDGYSKENPLVLRSLVPPHQKPDGTWVTIANSGTAPNVIG